MITQTCISRCHFKYIFKCITCGFVCALLKSQLLLFSFALQVSFSMAITQFRLFKICTCLASLLSFFKRLICR